MKNQIIQAVCQLNEEEVLPLVVKAMEMGMSPGQVLDCLNLGVEQVGKLYEDGTYFVSDLLMASYVYQEVLKLPGLVAYVTGKKDGTTHGTILACTVKNDIHDIGKNMFINMARSEGLTVLDLGIDVEPEAILRAIVENQVDILALSGTLTSSYNQILDVVALLTAQNLRQKVKITVGGLVATDELRLASGVDFCSRDVDLSIQQCKRWIGEAYGL